jgi:probable F420-dependent oxidoreductase
VKIDRGISNDPRHSGESARAAEADGYDGIWTSETSHDAFLPLVTAALATERISIGTGIAVAFSRNPMTMAYTAHDLHALSGGRVILGLGSQIKAHVVRRFSMEWSSPAPRMREYIEALHAIWRSWDEGEKLDFKGDFYSHTLMAPAFTPPPNATRPKVFLAGVGDIMTRVAGEVADGFFPHAFTTERYLRERTLPALEEGLERSGRTRNDIEIAGLIFAATGDTDEEIEASADAIRQQIAFYASTPAYRPVLDLHGWGELQPALTDLTRQGRWGEMSSLIDDDVLDAFAVRGTPEEIPKQLAHRFGDVLDRLNFYRQSDSRGIEALKAQFKR